MRMFWLAPTARPISEFMDYWWWRFHRENRTDKPTDRQESDMDMRNLFPSPWFSAQDFDAVGKELVIGNVMMQQVAAEFKPVVFFYGQDKGLVLNPTNNKLLIGMFGGESSEWTGKKIVLFSFQAMFAGQPQMRLGIRAPDGRAPAAEGYRPPDYAKQAREAKGDDMDDEIPF